jgi:hypothetical protein
MHNGDGQFVDQGRGTAGDHLSNVRAKV